MGYLAAYLQQEFSSCCPPGWSARHEVNVLSPDLRRLLGYSPRVDVLLEREDGSQRLWVEFEISRADPVANHAKFATAHLFQPQEETDAFISMITSHVLSGRRNLAANTVLVMRRLGMNAFQTVLLPTFPRKDIKRLNHLPFDQLKLESLSIDAEIMRALTVAKPVLAGVEGNIHFAGNVMEVLFNVYCWNRDLQTDTGRERWGKRTVTYFVYDPRFHRFAPSKFCAYVPVTRDYPAGAAEYMTVESYTSIERSNRIFDGTRARQHLVDNLTMRLMEPDERPVILRQFEKWQASFREVFNVHPAGPQFIVPPNWF